jgi:hypothetical protein
MKHKRREQKRSLEDIHHNQLNHREVEGEGMDHPVVPQLVEEEVNIEL